MSPFWLCFLRYVPIAVFAALIVPGLQGEDGEYGIRLLAAAAASLAIWRFGSLWLGIAPLKAPSMTPSWPASAYGPVLPG